MKKTLALVLALAMVFSTITVAFAEEAISADAQVCADLGMLKGATGTVDAAYTATAPSRIQAAVMFLRLKGLEAEATAFTGSANFADADKAAWAKPIMAYLKAHPELGWVGDGTNFDPAGAMTAQGYYKVMLEALGYKQNTASVVGDFTWDNVVAFAAGKGLTKVAAVANFTVNDLAVATVEALKANVKDASKTLVASLIEAGKVDKAKAVAANLYTEAVVASADLKAVKAIANNKLEVEFTAAVDKAFAENAASYKVVEKGTTTAVEVKGAVAQSDTIAVVEVAALTAGKSYTMVMGSVSMNFAGVAKDAVAPKIDTVKCIDTNTVEVTFDNVMDFESATNVANYTLNNNASVKAAELDSDREVVTLTTEGVANGKLYALKVQDVKSSDLVAIKSVSKNFTGKTDTAAPKIKELKVMNANLIRVTFTDDHGVSKEVAETLANWSINNDLAIEKVTAIDKDEDDYGYYEMVEVVTADQVAGKSYTLTIDNLVDGSTAANKVTKALTKDFKGAYADTSAPTVSANPAAATNTSVEIVFSDKNAIDEASATDVNNYEITYKDGSTTETLAVVGAKIKDTKDLYVADGRTVVLTTDEMEAKYMYTLVIKGVADEFGNEIEPVSGTTYKKYTYRGMDEDTIPPYVASVNATNENTVKVVFDNKVDKASATDPTNYSFNNDLGVALKASLSKTDSKTVTLTTPDQVVGKSYTLTINGVKDLSGNECSAVKVGFIAARTSNDTEAPEVSYMEATFEDELLVHFNEAVKPADGTFSNITLTANSVTFTAKGTLLDDETTVVMKPASDMTAVKYTVSALNNIADKTGNAYVAPTDAHEFWGTTEANEGPEVSSWEQLDPTTIRVVFTEPVLLKGAALTAGELNTGYTNPTGVTVDWAPAVDPDGDEDNNGYSTIDLVADDVLPIVEDADPIEFNFTAFVTDYVGTAAVDENDTDTDATKATFVTTYIEDEDKPEITNVEASNTNKIVVTFNEDVMSGAGNVGTYKISYDDDGTTKYVSVSSIARDANTYSKVNITTGTALDSDFVYTLVPLTGAKDLSGNVLATKDVSFDFAGTDVKVVDFVKGVDVLDASTIRVTSSKNISAVNAVYEIDENGDEITVDISNGSEAIDPDSETPANNKLVEVYLDRPALAGTTYVVYVDGMAYKFDGIVDDSGIRVLDGDAVVTFSGMDDSKQTVTMQTAAKASVAVETTVDGAFGITGSVTSGTVYYVTVTRTTDGVVLYAAKVTAED